MMKREKNPNVEYQLPTKLYTTDLKSREILYGPKFRHEDQQNLKMCLQENAIIHKHITVIRFSVRLHRSSQV